MTGANCDGSTECRTETPAQYGALRFHSDDMAEAGWPPSLHLTIPADWRSGFYTLRLQAGIAEAGPVESHVGFFIRAPLDKPRAKLAFVASTATFLAYANSALRLDQMSSPDRTRNTSAASCSTRSTPSSAVAAGTCQAPKNCAPCIAASPAAKQNFDEAI